MNYLDIAVFAVILLSALLALVRGFVRELLSVLAWVVAAVVALYAFPHVQPLAQDAIGIGWIANVAAGGGLFLVTLVVVSVLSGLLAGRIQDSNFKTLDRSLGFVFGALRGAVLLCLGYLLLIWFFNKPENVPGWLMEARSRPYLQQGAEFLIGLAPREFAEDFAAGGSLQLPRVDQPLDTVTDMLTPAPTTPADSGDRRDGYTDDQRKSMDQLFHSQQD